jgi:hypothetical protein
MNEQKLKKLFTAAQNETAPLPPAHFAGDVLRAIRSEKQNPLPEAFSVLDQLNRLFPKLAWAAVIVILVGVATDFGLTTAGIPNLSDGISQISSQWLFAGNGF